MDCRLCCAAVVLLTACSLGWGQWQQGVPVSKPQTIRVAVDKAAGPAGLDPAVPGAPQQAPTANDPKQAVSPQSQVPFRRGPMANQPMANNFFNGFAPYLYDNDAFQNKICGMSRQAMTSPRSGASFWALNMMDFGNVFTCSCFMGDITDAESIDHSLRASRDCMTPMTGLMCCLT